MRQPLIDSDILCYEVGFAAETGWQGEGYVQFDYVAELLDNRIANICGIVEATEPPILYLTGKGNFRYDIAKRTPYKDRPSNKPWHYKNIKAYIKGKYDYVESQGMEADDLLAIEQTKRPDETIICSRDKDLFNFSGWKYSWEMGNQPSRGPYKVEGFGSLTLRDNGKLIGDGELFFYFQCLTGDIVDSIPGVPGIGPKKAYSILSDCTCREDAYNRVLGVYNKVFKEAPEEELLEQARLLHLISKTDGNKILMWNPPKVNYEDWYDIDTGKIERTF